MTLPIWVIVLLLSLVLLTAIGVVVWVRRPRCPSCTSIRVRITERRASGVEHYVCGKCGHGFTNF